jgi:hypothetical protein
MIEGMDKKLPESRALGQRDQVHVHVDDPPKTGSC